LIASTIALSVVKDELATKGLWQLLIIRVMFQCSRIHLTNLKHFIVNTKNMNQQLSIYKMYLKILHEKNITKFLKDK